ncbi:MULTISPECIES: amidohydrolase family protein [Fischerella]|uniref:amidohydrolase family protein n=1 Tax=Fischerella TaxID=1190 RepID=UPI002155C39D|nr:MULTISPECIES: amidohydrolase family protein [Fischerella]
MRLRYSLIIGILILIVIGLTAQFSYAQTRPFKSSHTPSFKLFENVRIFDGISEQLSAPSNVLVVANKIQTISTASIPTPTEISVTRINGGGRVLMPGLINAHTHVFMETTPVEKLLSPDTPTEALFQQAQKNATAMLMRGFTSARDMAGPVFELKKAIDSGKVVGPRIWPSGA